MITGALFNYPHSMSTVTVDNRSFQSYLKNWTRYAACQLPELIFPSYVRVDNRGFQSYLKSERRYASCQLSEYTNVAFSAT